MIVPPVLVVPRLRERLPLAIVKFDVLWREQLLEGPSSCEPFVGGDVVEDEGGSEVDDADVGVAVPSEHGADGFVEFGAAVFVDAAGVGPGKAAVVRAGFGAEEEEFVQAGAGGGVVDVDGEGLGECGLVKSSNWVTCDARG